MRVTAKTPEFERQTPGLRRSARGMPTFACDAFFQLVLAAKAKTAHRHFSVDHWLSSNWIGAEWQIEQSIRPEAGNELQENVSRVAHPTTLVHSQ